MSDIETTRQFIETIIKLSSQRAALVEALKEARGWLSLTWKTKNPAVAHDSHCSTICNNGGPCDCPVPKIDAALKEVGAL